MKELGAKSVKMSIEEVTRMNRHMEEVRREYKIKETASWESASKIVFNA